MNINNNNNNKHITNMMKWKSSEFYDFTPAVLEDYAALVLEAFPEQQLVEFPDD